MSIEITIDGKPADHATVAIFSEALDALEKRNSESYETFTAISQREAEKPEVVKAYVAHFDRVRALQNGVSGLLGRIVTAQTFGPKA